MLQPLDVRFNKEVLKPTNFEVFEMFHNLDCFHVNFILLYVHYFLDCLSDIKDHLIFCEIFLILVEDGIVKNIVDEEVDELGR